MPRSMPGSPRFARMLAVLIFAVSLSMLGATSRARGDTTTQTVPGTQVLHGVACPGPTFCVAVGTNPPGIEGVVVTATSGMPGDAQLVTGTASLESVACPIADTCLAVGSDSSFAGQLVTITAGIAGDPAPVPGAGDLRGIACPTATMCLAVGSAFGQGALVPIVNGTPGSPEGVTGTSGFESVACPSATSCVAVGATPSSQGAVVLITGGVAGPPQILPDAADLTAVACRTSTACVAVGQASGQLEGIVVPITNGVGGSAQDVTGTMLFFGAACFTSNACTAVGEVPDPTNTIAGVIVPLTNDSAGPLEVVPATWQLQGVACPAATSCVADGLTSQPSFTGVITSFTPDTDLGLANLPADITASATSGAGAVVSYASPTASDEQGDDPPASVSCDPASGSLFPVGTTIVNCSATDPDDVPSQVTGTFRVTVRTPSDSPQTGPCTTTITGSHPAQVVAAAGNTCLDHAIVRAVSVSPGAALSVTASSVQGTLTANRASAIVICGSTVNARVTVQGTTGLVLIGGGSDAYPAPCAGNSLKAAVSLTGNQGGVELGSNTMAASASVKANTAPAGPAEDGSVEIEGNSIGGTLACSANSPAPSNDGQPNTLLKGASGQCLGL